MYKSQRDLSAELKEVLEYHTKAYPKLQPQDAVKLLYQNEFGGGHIIPDHAISLQRLIKECEGLEPDDRLSRCEDIGFSWVRLNLRAFGMEELSKQTINRLFVVSSEQKQGSIAFFGLKLNILRDLSDKGIFAFSKEELDDYLERYSKEGFPIVSHSRVYRETYRPAYRVILKKFEGCIELFMRLDKLLEQQESIVVAIDGNCGSGKSTLAMLLQQIYGCNVISMDDFFLPNELRTHKRLQEAGGNIHYERFLSEVVEGIKSGSPFFYRVFDCKTGEYGGEKSFSPKRITVVEGSYSLHPNFSGVYDLKVFAHCSHEEQKRRILKRSGEDLFQRFVDEWIPMEEKYFQAFQIRENSDVLVDTDRYSLLG